MSTDELIEVVPWDGERMVMPSLVLKGHGPSMGITGDAASWGSERIVEDR